MDIRIKHYVIRDGMKKAGLKRDPTTARLLVLRVDGEDQVLVRTFQYERRGEGRHAAMEKAMELVHDLLIVGRTVRLRLPDEYMRDGLGLRPGDEGAVVQLHRFRGQHKKHLRYLVEFQRITRRVWVKTEEVELLEEAPPPDLHIPTSAWRDVHNYLDLPMDRPLLVAHGADNRTAAVTWWMSQWNYWYSGEAVPPEILEQVHHYMDTHLSPDFFEAHG